MTIRVRFRKVTPYRTTGRVVQFVDYAPLKPRISRSDHTEDWKNVTCDLSKCLASCWALMGVCKRTAHARCCHRFAANAAFTRKAATWPVARASGGGRRGSLVTIRKYKKRVYMKLLQIGKVSYSSAAKSVLSDAHDDHTRERPVRIAIMIKREVDRNFISELTVRLASRMVDTDVHRKRQPGVDHWDLAASSLVATAQAVRLHVGPVHCEANRTDYAFVKNKVFVNCAVATSSGKPRLRANTLVRAKSGRGTLF